MFTINAIAKQANVGFDTARAWMKQLGIHPATSYNNGKTEVQLYSQDAMNEIVAHAATMHAKRAANKMKKLKKLVGPSSAIINADNSEVLNGIAYINKRLDEMEKTLARIEAGLPSFNMEVTAL